MGVMYIQSGPLALLALVDTLVSPSISMPRSALALVGRAWCLENARIHDLRAMHATLIADLIELCRRCGVLQMLRPAHQLRSKANPINRFSNSDAVPSSHK